MTITLWIFLAVIIAGIAAATVSTFICHAFEVRIKKLLLVYGLRDLEESEIEDAMKRRPLHDSAGPWDSLVQNISQEARETGHTITVIVDEEGQVIEKEYHDVEPTECTGTTDQASESERVLPSGDVSGL